MAFRVVPRDDWQSLTVGSLCVRLVGLAVLVAVYRGLVWMLPGTALLVGFAGWTVLLAAGLLFVELRVRTEEGLMLAAFPETYPRYRRRVPQLVPGLRRLRRP